MITDYIHHIEDLPVSRNNGGQPAFEPTAFGVRHGNFISFRTVKQLKVLSVYSIAIRSVHCIGIGLVDPV